MKTVVIFAVVFGAANGAESKLFTLNLLDPSLDLVYPITPTSTTTELCTCFPWNLFPLSYLHAF